MSARGIAAPTHSERVLAVAEVPQKQRWSLTKEAFDTLLACLDTDPERAGEKYEQIRSGLVRFFQWRGCPFSEDNADETINRVARKLSQGEEFRDIYTYVYGVARMLVLEIKKESAKHQATIDSLSRPQLDSHLEDRLQSRAECLKSCLERLPVESREMILSYYQGERRKKIESRRKLAQAFSIPANVLRNRAYRLRERLQACVEDCLTERQGGNMR
jgi:DNA-directed RNA polymerase specialized sigma24 family protein